MIEHWAVRDPSLSGWALERQSSELKEVRAEVEDCGDRLAGLSSVGDWSGPARWAFDLAVQEIIGRLAAASSTLAAASANTRRALAEGEQHVG